MKLLANILGWYGAAAILLAYGLLSFSVIAANSAAYQLLNLIGAIGIVAVSMTKKNYQPAVLNAVWVIIAAIALIKLFV